MRSIVAAATALVLAVAVAAPADALTIQRTWRGSVSDGKAGTHKLVAYTDGSGHFHVNLKGLRANATYRIEIRKGKCGDLGTILHRPGSVTTGSTGAVQASRVITMDGMNSIWPTSRSTSISARYYSGTSVRCGLLSFRKSTRIRIPYYDIDLPVIKSPSGYPPCGVGMYLKELYQPTEPGVTYIAGHARSGMFLPLLKASKTNDGAAMIGKTVYVYTSDSRRHRYEIIQVRRHVESIQNVFGVTSERLWIQTSEGPNWTYPKLIVVAKRTSTIDTTYAASHPTPRPYSC